MPHCCFVLLRRMSLLKCCKDMDAGEGRESMCRMCQGTRGKASGGRLFRWTSQGRQPGQHSIAAGDLRDPLGGGGKAAEQGGRPQQAGRCAAVAARSLTAQACSPACAAASVSAGTQGCRRQGAGVGREVSGHPARLGSNLLAAGPQGQPLQPVVGQSSSGTHLQ